MPLCTGTPHWILVLCMSRCTTKAVPPNITNVIFKQPGLVYTGQALVGSFTRLDCTRLCNFSSGDMATTSLPPRAPARVKLPRERQRPLILLGKDPAALQSSCNMIFYALIERSLFCFVLFSYKADTFQLFCVLQLNVLKHMTNWHKYYISFFSVFCCFCFNPNLSWKKVKKKSI